MIRDENNFRCVINIQLGCPNMLCTRVPMEGCPWIPIVPMWDLGALGTDLPIAPRWSSDAPKQII